MRPNLVKEAAAQKNGVANLIINGRQQLDPEFEVAAAQFVQGQKCKRDLMISPPHTRT
jgi:hypothetical protein